MFQVPAVVTMTIAATRMHRSLVDFTCESSDGCAILHLYFFPAHYGRCRFSVEDNSQTSGLKFSKSKQTHARPVPPNPMKITVHTIFEQDLTQMSDHGLSIHTDEEAHKKPSGSSGSSLDEDVERGE
jgi:hypothetical protein